MYKEHIINKDEHFIAGWYMSPSLCSSIYNELIENQDTLVDGDDDPDGKKFRNYRFAVLSDFSNDNFNHYTNSLQNILELYFKKYDFSNQVARFLLDPYVKAQLYDPGKYYDQWHFEYTGVHTFKNCFRHLVFLTYLNECDGGTEFFYQKLSVKPEPGLTLIWPVIWTHAHRGIPASTPKGVVTGWFHFPLDS